MSSQKKPKKQKTASASASSVKTTIVKNEQVETKLIFGAAILDLLQNTAYNATKHPKDGFVEVEIRLGKYGTCSHGNRKRCDQGCLLGSGVSSVFFEQTLQLIREAKQFDPEQSDFGTDGKDLFHESFVFYYEHNTIRCNRTSLNLKTKEDLEYETTTRLQDMVFLNSKNQDPDRYDLRIATKIETKLKSPTTIKDPTKYSSVRFKRRQTYVFPEKGFKLDFTIAQSSTDKSKIKSAPKKFEIEMELIPNSATTTTTTSLSLLTNAVCLLGRGVEEMQFFSPQ